MKAEPYNAIDESLIKKRAELVKNNENNDASFNGGNFG